MPRISRRRTLAIAALSAALLAVVAVAATAGPAVADSTINVHYAVTGTAFLKKLNTTANLGSGTLSATVDLTTGAQTSTLSLPPSTISTKEFGIIPVTATTEMIQNGPATGTANLSTNTITSTASVTLKIDKLTALGLTLPVGNSCETSPFTVTLTSGAGFTIGGGGPVNGSFPLPQFHHCLLNTLLLNLTIPGPGNTLNLTLGPLQIG